MHCCEAARLALEPHAGLGRQQRGHGGGVAFPHSHVQGGHAAFALGVAAQQQVCAGKQPGVRGKAIVSGIPAPQLQRVPPPRSFPFRPAHPPPRPSLQLPRCLSHASPPPLPSPPGRPPAHLHVDLGARPHQHPHQLRAAPLRSDVKRRQLAGRQLGGAVGLRVQTWWEAAAAGGYTSGGEER